LKCGKTIKLEYTMLIIHMLSKNLQKEWNMPPTHMVLDGL